MKHDSSAGCRTAVFIRARTRQKKVPDQYCVLGTDIPQVAMTRRLLLLVGAASLSSSCDFQLERGAKLACQEETVSVLKSPSSFNLVWSDVTLRGPFSFAEFKEAAEARGRRAAADSTATPHTDSFLEAMHKKDVRDGTWAKQLQTSYASYQKWAPEEKNTAFVLLEYDAENAFGASLRGFSICRFGPAGNDKKFGISDIVQSGPIPLQEGRAAKDVAEELGEK